MMDYLSLSEAKINHRSRLSTCSSVTKMALVSSDDSCQHLDIGLISLGVAKWCFSNYVILPAFIT